MKRFLNTMEFLGRSFSLTMIFGAVLAGFSCFRHGDVGPYPELDYMAWVVPLAMLMAFVSMAGVWKAPNRTRP